MTGPLVSGRPDISPADFMARPVPAVSIAPPLSGNTAWAATYAREMRSIVEQRANGSGRSRQRYLGPSELGHSCHRQVAGKLAQLPRINFVGDPWPSIMGTAGHAWLERALIKVNERLGRIRFLTEYRVTPTGPFSDHPGTGDGYDADHNAVIDHKFLGVSTLTKLRRDGPPRHYFVQFLLYMLGFRALGLPVDRIVLLAWPRTKSTLDDMYVWEHIVTDEDLGFLDEIIAPELAYRKQWAAALITGAAQLTDVPADPQDECYFCPYYRPASARDGAPGCPGHATGQQ